MSTESTVASVQASTEGMKPNYSHGSLKNVKQLLAQHVKDKVGIFDSLYTLNEQIPEMKRYLSHVVTVNSPILSHTWNKY